MTELEEENVKFEKEIEERQLIWEHRELDLERKIDELEKQQNSIADAARRVRYHQSYSFFFRSNRLNLVRRSSWQLSRSIVTSCSSTRTSINYYSR